jgi:hypothetical protein
MRFMLLMIPKGYESAAPDAMPAADAVAEMMKYNEAMQKSGILMSCEGLHPPAVGARVSFADGKPVVTPGPFAGVSEVLGGFWMINVASREDAIDWATRCPAGANEIIEVRQVQEVGDFPQDVQDVLGDFVEMQTKSGH